MRHEIPPHILHSDVSFVDLLSWVSKGHLKFLWSPECDLYHCQLISSCANKCLEQFSQLLQRNMQRGKKFHLSTQGIWQRQHHAHLSCVIFSHSESSYSQNSLPSFPVPSACEFSDSWLCPSNTVSPPPAFLCPSSLASQDSRGQSYVWGCCSCLVMETQVTSQRAFRIRPARLFSVSERAMTHSASLV